MVTDKLEILIKMKNIQLQKYIAFKEEWDYKELCKKYIK